MAKRPFYHHQQPPRSPTPRHRRHPPGANDLPRPQRRRKHLHWSRQPGQHCPLAANVPRSRRHFGAARCQARCPQLGAGANAGGAAGGGNCQSPLARCARPHHGRANRLSLGPRSRSTLQARQNAQSQRGQHPVHQPPHGRSVFHCRPGDGTTRRPFCLHPSRQRSHPRIRHPRHGWAAHGRLFCQNRQGTRGFAAVGARVEQGQCVSRY